jgi:hypothetical protein
MFIFSIYNKQFKDNGSKMTYIHRHDGQYHENVGGGGRLL